VLYVIASPIGNLGDITIRALEVLREVDLIAAEDTRHTSVLLHRYEIRKPLTSLHEHNEARRTAELVERLQAGASIALLTDAGTPSVSDPGFRLITACRKADLPLTVLPGPSAVLTALVGSGLPTHAFYFGGFLPAKSGQRSRELSVAIARDCTSIYFESPHRLQKSLTELEVLAPSHPICVGRELTKQFETFHRGTTQELRKHFSDHPPRGEITLVIAPASRKRGAVEDL
jgi:probable S-adenosylmethionine-dependent methyltransferase, YraL family